MHKCNSKIKKIFSLLMIMAMVITSVNFSMIQTNAAESNGNEVTTTALTYNGYPVQRGFGAIPSQINDNDRKYSVHYYSDGYFMDSSSNSSAKYNEHLATMSSALAMAAVCEQDYFDEAKTDPWKSNMAEDILTSSGFEAGYKNGGDDNHETTLNRTTVGNDTVGAVYGYKTVGTGDDKCLIVPIVIRDLGLGIEWYGNLDIGTEGDAAGIRKHSNEVKTAVTAYIDALKQEKGIDKVKYWVTGFSVGASIADLLAADLTDAYGAENVYSYIFNPIAAAYATEEKAASYKNIHYIENYNDFLQYLMPDFMGMRVLGTKHEIANTSDEVAFKAEEERMLEQLDFVKNDIEDCEYESPLEFQKAKINQKILKLNYKFELITLLPDVINKTLDAITLDGDPGNYQHEIGVLLHDRLQESGLTRSNAASTTMDANITSAAKKLSVEPYTFQQTLQRALELYGQGTFSGLDKDKVEDMKETIKDHALGGMLKHDDTLFDLLDLVRDGSTSSFASLTKDTWDMLTSKDFSIISKDKGLHIDDALVKGFGEEQGENLTKEIKKALPALLYYAPQIACLDVQQKTQFIASIIENIQRLLQAHSPEVTHAYMRIEDSYYDAEFMQTLQRYGYQESNIFDKSDSEKIPYMKRNEGYDKAVETSITGINGQSLDGMTIEFNNYNGEQIYKMVISGDSVEKIIWKNNRDRVYFSPTIGPDGKIDELSIFTYDRGYIIDIFTDNDSEDTARKYRIQRKYHDRLTRPVSQKTWDYNKIIEDEVRKLDYIDVDMYKDQQMRIIVCDFAFNDDIKLKNMNRVGKFVSPHLSVIKCGVSADASTFIAEPNYEKGKNIYNEIRYTYKGYKAGDTNYHIINLDSGEEKEPTDGKRWDSYGYDSKNPHIQLVIDHNATSHNAVPATCTADGNIAYWYCDACGKYYSDASCKNEISADSWVISAEGHHLSENAAHEATCTADGNIAYWYCNVCGKYYSDKACKNEVSVDSWVLSKLGHRWSSWETTKQATATEKGLKERHCLSCDATESEDIPATGGGDDPTPPGGGGGGGGGGDTGDTGDVEPVEALVIDSSSYTVIIPKEMMAIADAINTTITVNLPKGHVIFDAETIRKIGTQQNATLKITRKYNNKKTSKATIIKYGVTIKSGGKYKTQFGTGKVELKLQTPAGLSSSTKKKALYMSGKYAIDMNAKVSGGYATFTTNHFSTFQIMKSTATTSLIKKSIKASTVGAPKLSTASKTITLTWSDGKGNTPYSYAIYRSLKSKSGFKKVGTLSNSNETTKNTFVDSKSLKAGKRYYYKIVGKVKLGNKTYNTKYSSTKNIKCK